MDNNKIPFTPQVWLDGSPKEATGNSQEATQNRKLEVPPPRQFAPNNSIAFISNVTPVNSQPPVDRHYRYMRVTQSDPRDSSNKSVAFIPILLEKPFNCQVCKRTFATRGGLQKHTRTHQEGKNYVCETCGQQFTVESYLKRHLLTHEGGQSFACDLCPMVFLSNHSLRAHRVSHTRTRPHVCTVCGKSFTTPSYLTVHLRIHTGEKPYSCNICGKAFARRSNLRAHHVSHTREKLHRCIQCDESFLYRKQLDEHVKSHEKVVVTLTCPYCGLGFHGVGQYADHIDRHCLRSAIKGEAGSQPSKEGGVGSPSVVRNFVVRPTPTRAPLPKIKTPATGPARAGGLLKSQITRRVEYDAILDQHFKPIVCEDCGDSFITTSTLEAHVLTHIDAQLPSEFQDINDVIKQQKLLQIR